MSYRRFSLRCIRRPRGFTLVELLVVIGIIGLLMSILLPSLGRARDFARRAKCLSNLRQVGISMMVYAQENRQRLPMHHGGGSWLWDIPIQTRDALVKDGGIRDILYCPAAQDRNVNDLWTYQPDYGVMGYFFLHKRYPGHPNAPTMPGPWPTNVPKTMIKAEFIDKLTMKQPAERPLVTDATLSQKGNFFNVVGGYKKLPDNTNHIKDNDSKPEGGHILYLDGHATWTSFSEMIMRCAAGDVSFWF